MSEGIGPGRSRNRYLAVCVAVIAVFPLFLGLSSIPPTRAEEWFFPVMFLGPGLLLAAWAVWLWRRPQGRATSVEFTEKGLLLKRWKRGAVQREMAIEWGEVREIREAAGGYGARWIELLLTHDGAKVAGLVRDTTRADASDMLVGRKIRIHAMEFDPPCNVAIKRMLEAACRAGFSARQTTSRFYLILWVSRWVLQRD